MPQTHENVPRSLNPLLIKFPHCSLELAIKDMLNDPAYSVQLCNIKSEYNQETKLLTSLLEDTIKNENKQKKQLVLSMHKTANQVKGENFQVNKKREESVKNNLADCEKVDIKMELDEDGFTA